MGPMVEYHGLRQPSFCNLDGMLRRMAHEQPEIWDYVTANGSFVPFAEAAFDWQQRRAA